MMRSMFSGVSGLRAHQLKMDVIGNNIANVNTVGYKGQRATFQEVFSQTIKGASSPQLGRGGTNPQQVGLGISLSSIDTFHIRGSAMRTDNPSDLAINGDGFFILSNSSDFLSRTYTRAGNFTLDEDGNLVASNGYRVLGYMEDEGKNPAPDGSTVLKGVMEGLVISKSKSFPAKSTDRATMAGNLDNNLKRVPKDKPDPADPTDPTKNIKLSPAEFIDIAADQTLEFSGGVKFRETTSVFYDSLGGEHKVKFTFVRGVNKETAGTAKGSAPANAAGDHEWVVIVQNLEDKTYWNETTKSWEAVSPTTPLANIMVPIEFDSKGEITTNPAKSTVDKLSFTMQGKNGAGSFDVDVNFEGLTQFANESTASITNKSGYKQGYLDTFSIGPSGEITGIFTNGQSRIIGQVALAGFKTLPA